MGGGRRGCYAGPSRKEKYTYREFYAVGGARQRNKSVRMGGGNRKKTCWGRKKSPPVRQKRKKAEVGTLSFLR